MAFSKPNRVAEALNELRSFNLHNTAPCNVVLRTITDYFLESSDSETDEQDNNSTGSDSDTSVGSEPEENIHDAISGDLLTGGLDGFGSPVMLQTDRDSVHSDVHVDHEQHGPDNGVSVNVDQEGDTESLADSEDMPFFEKDDENAQLMRGMAICNDELKAITDFDCKCQKAKQGLCIKKFDETWILALRRNMQEMTESEKDLVIMSTVRVHLNNSDLIVNNKHGKLQGKSRERQFTKYVVEDVEVCREAFRFMHLISQNKLTACISWYKKHSLCAREKKWGGRRFNTRALTFEDMERIKTFLINFAEQYALVLPGRVPGFKRRDIKLLPSCESKSSIWRKYTRAVKELGHRAVKLNPFKNAWQKLCPHIVKTKSMTDLCNTCQDNNNKISRSVRLPVAVREAKLRKQLDHLRIVEEERNVYRTMVKTSKETACQIGVTGLSTNPPCSRNISMHYSFDFAQQVHFPCSPSQPGPIYFLTPRKCAVFGVCCEALPQQINYLIDEGMATTKGADAVLSYLHHFFAVYGLGEKKVDLHCDSGQNRNKYMVWYLLWRVMHGYHEEIMLNFFIAGHTKFAPDWCFGFFKVKYRRSEVDTLDDIANAVNSSTTTGVNRAQLVGDEQGNVFVKTYNWKEFLEPYFKQLDGIKSFHSLRFDRNHPGVVFVKEFSSFPEKAVPLLKKANVHPPAVITMTVPCPGLDAKRQQYLFEKIRNFCLREESKDTVCPKPAVPKDESSGSEDENVPVQPKKRGRNA